jgi:hypothetical protein
MDFFYIVIGAFVVYTALMKRELLVQERSFRIILLVSVILFLAGLVDLALFFTGGSRYFVSGALLCPLITLVYYRLSRKVFLKYVKREPKDTSFVSSEKDLEMDMLFNIQYLTLAFVMVAFISGGVERMVTLLGSQ